MDTAQSTQFLRVATLLLIASVVAAILPSIVMAVTMASICAPMMQMMPGMPMPGGMMR